VPPKPATRLPSIGAKKTIFRWQVPPNPLGTTHLSFADEYSRIPSQRAFRQVWGRDTTGRSGLLARGSRAGGFETRRRQARR
jgi:hypothetical protein